MWLHSMGEICFGMFYKKKFFSLFISRANFDDICVPHQRYLNLGILVLLTWPACNPRSEFLALGQTVGNRWNLQQKNTLNNWNPHLWVTGLREMCLWQGLAFSLCCLARHVRAQHDTLQCWENLLLHRMACRWLDLLRVWMWHNLAKSCKFCSCNSMTLFQRLCFYRLQSVCSFCPFMNVLHISCATKWSPYALDHSRS